MSIRLPRQRLPVAPSAEHLRKQAKQLAQAERLSLAQAQLALARSYGNTSWPRLMRMVATMARGAKKLQGPHSPMEPLPDAANRGDLAAVQAILARGETTQHDLDLALARAVLRFTERSAIAEALVAAGADPNGQYGAAYGPIVLVTGECLDPEGLAFLLEHGADVTFPPVKTKYGPASPMIATLSTYMRGANDRKHRCIELLLAHGALMPTEVTPEMFAIHRGDVGALTQLLDREPSLVQRRYPTMPSGNMRLAGGTLLHLAVEIGEPDCIDLLLARGADANAPAEVIDGLGGQTPFFHAVATLGGAGLPIVEQLLQGGRRVDTTVRARCVIFGDPLPTAMTILEYARWCAREEVPAIQRTQPRELALLEEHIGPTA